MRRALAFLFRNWPLKLAAVLLATLLYGGLIVSASAETFQGRIAIQVLHQPADTWIIGNLEDVTTIRYFAIGTDRPLVTSASFTATIDLADVSVPPGGPPVSVPVVVRASDPAVQVVDFTPSRIQVRLDPLVHKEVPVEVDRGVIPPGLDVRDPVVSQSNVTVSGPESSIRLVAAAVARVRIDPSGLDVNESVDLIAVDARNEVVDAVDIEPGSVRVTIQIGSHLSTRTIPINAVVTGAPSPSSEVVSVDVSPALVTVEGDANALAGLDSIDTRPISIAGATSDVATSVGLVLPSGVTALGVTNVKVTLVVQPRQGTRSFEVGIEIVNDQAGLAYAPSVDHVLVTLGGTLDALATVDAAKLVARLDVGGLGAGGGRITPDFALPTGVSLVSVSPAQVVLTATPVSTPTPAPPTPSLAPASPTPGP